MIGYIKSKRKDDALLIKVIVNKIKLKDELLGENKSMKY